MKVILTHKPASIYDDVPWDRYHFPRTYLGPIERAVGDLAIYYEPRREGQGDRGYRGRQAYVATARITGVRRDLAGPDSFYAEIGDYLEFERPVPFVDGGHYHESALRRHDGKTNRGAFGRAVRPLPEVEFDAILRAGFAEPPGLPEEGPRAGQGLSEAAVAFIGADHALDAPRERLLVARSFRDRAFARIVQQAYDGTCAFTGLRLVNGGGRLEAEAAHIRPVEDRGPDTIRNGLALSGTIHWLFDRGLVSIGDDARLLVKADKVPDAIRRLLHADGKARLPQNPLWRPSPVFLGYHRRRHGHEAA